MRRSLQPVQDRDTSFSWESIDSQVYLPDYDDAADADDADYYYEDADYYDDDPDADYYDDGDATGGFETLFT